LQTTSATQPASVALLSRITLICLSLLTLPTISLWGQKGVPAVPGIAWRVRGPWQADGKSTPILAGDAILPGSLLRPGESTLNPSITLLLSDGQRILYECFTVEDCARGFRVPSLYRDPEPFAVEMLARIHAVLAGGHGDLSTETGKKMAPRLPRDEAMAVLGSDNQVEVAGLAANLSNGRYTYDLRPLDSAIPRQFHLALDKTAPSINLALPAPGLYDLTIADELNSPRIDLLIAAVRPAQAAGMKKSFLEAKALMGEWNGDYYGWPIHDFQRAYLESLMVGERPPFTRNRASERASNAEVPGRLGDKLADRVGVASEPGFDPRPGLYDGDTVVTLRCDTPGAVIRFTVDGSQPVASSPVYLAPIMVKGTELTIKSFASLAGGKGSAVVTGIFRIQ
jgi:hypothetical protein